MTETLERSLPFYNMQASILFQGIIIEENIAIKNFWEKGDEIILDVYFYSSKQSKIIDSAYIRTLKNLNTTKNYNHISEFVADFKKELLKEENEGEKETPPQKANFDFSYLKDLEDDLVLLSFLTNLSKSFHDIKVKVVADFIRRHKPYAESLSEQYIDAYLENLEATEEGFYQSLNKLSYRSVDSATELLKEAIKICAADGTVNYVEKKYLAEILQTFREHGVNPDVSF